jgi:hypothetical protein
LDDRPRKFNGLLQFFGVPKNEGTLYWNASEQNLDTDQPKHRLWKEFVADLETSKPSHHPPSQPSIPTLR